MNEIKISKNGLVTKKGEYGKDILFRNALPVFITPSLKEVLRTFGSDIEILKANGSREIQNIPIEMENLGIFLSTEMKNQCIVDYDKSFLAINKHDDLSPMNIEKIIKALEQNKIVDCAVTRLRLMIKDEKLREIIADLYPNAKPLSNIFFADFESSCCEGERDTEIWEDTPCNQELLKLKFKKTLLHCIKLIDDGQIFAVKRAKRFYYINWNPTPRELENGEFQHKSPEEIAHALVGSFGEYGYVKKYKITSENKLELIEMN